MSLYFSIDSFGDDGIHDSCETSVYDEQQIMEIAVSQMAPSNSKTKYVYWKKDMVYSS